MRQLWLCIAIVSVLLNACSSSSIDAPTKPATDPPSVAIVQSPTETEVVSNATPQTLVQSTTTPTSITPLSTPSATPTSVQPVNDTQACTYASTFVEDITIQDGSILPTGETVEKIWRVLNSGSCSWDTGTALIHIKGHKFDTSGRIFVPPALPGDEVDVYLTFTTPKQPGVYESYWRLANSGGNLFGGVLFIHLKTSSSADYALPTPQSATPEPQKRPLTTPALQPTVNATSLATLQPTATVPLDCSDYDPQYMGVLSQASLLRIDVGCATGSVYQGTGIIQEFWLDVNEDNPHQRFRSFILKINATGTVYVLVGEDTFTYEATVAVYEVETYNKSNVNYICDAPIEPDGYIIPQDSIAKVWCNGQYWDEVGWPKQDQIIVDLESQATERGVIIKVSTLEGMLYFLALDLGMAQGTVQMGP